MGNENKLQLKFAVVVVFLNEIFSFYLGFPWDVIFYPSGLLYNFFWVFFSIVCLYYHLLLLKKKTKKTEKPLHHQV